MTLLPHLTKPAHLSDEQMSCLLDDPCGASEAARLHLGCCADCQAEVATLRSAFGNFRAAATSYSALHLPREAARQAVATPQPWLSRGPLWAASFATVVALGISLSVLHVHHPAASTQPAAAVAAANQDSDEALLDGIQRDLATSVPPSLEPLQVSTTTGANDLHN